MSDPTTPPTPDPSTGDVIGSDIKLVGDIVGPIVAELAPGIGTGINLAFKVLAVVEPAAFNAVVALMSGKDLTPEQLAAMTAIENKLQNPDAYLDPPQPS
jgi:hypothetical protein